MKLSLSAILKIVGFVKDAVDAAQKVKGASGADKKTIAITKAVKKSARTLKGADGEAAVDHIIESIFDAKDMIDVPDGD